MYYNYRDDELIRKFGLKVPTQHKYLSYISRPLDLILCSDNLEVFKIFQEKYPDTNTERLLKACLEYGASSCFTYFFENTKSPSYYLEKLFNKPEDPVLGVQCFYYFARNNDMLQTIDKVCDTFFPGKNALDLLKDYEQTEYCAARFGIQGRLKIAEKLLDKLDSPIYMINNMHVFDSAYANKASGFCNLYLTKIEEKKLVEPFLLSLFSTPDVGSNQRVFNFFYKFTKEINNKDSVMHQVINDFLVRNIKNDAIKPEFQELMMAYCICNKNFGYFNLYNEARPLDKQNILSTIKEPYKYLTIQQEPYRYIKDRTTYGLNMKNNALNVFNADKSFVDKWISTNQDLGYPEKASSLSSLFCLGDRYNFISFVKALENHIDWEDKDKNGNNFAHYLASFFEKVDKSMHTSIPFNEMLVFVESLVKDNPLPLGVRNNDGLAPGEALIKTLRTSKSLESASSTLSIRNIYLEKISKLENLLNYAILNNDLSTKETTTKRMKI